MATLIDEQARALGRLFTLYNLARQFQGPILLSGLSKEDSRQCSREYLLGAVQLAKDLAAAMGKLLASGFDVPDSWLTVRVHGKWTKRYDPTLPPSKAYTFGHSGANVDAIARVCDEVYAAYLRTVHGKATPKGSDDSGWIAFGEVWPGKFKTYKLAKAFLKAHLEIHTRKPSKQRVQVWAADWHRHWALQDGKVFDGLDAGTEPKPITPGLTGDFLAGAMSRYAPLLVKKVAENRGK